jgi:hypothetical protein
MMERAAHNGPPDTFHEKHRRREPLRDPRHPTQHPGAAFARYAYSSCTARDMYWPNSDRQMEGRRRDANEHAEAADGAGGYGVRLQPRARLAHRRRHLPPALCRHPLVGDRSDEALKVADAVAIVVSAPPQTTNLSDAPHLSAAQQWNMSNAVPLLCIVRATSCSQRRAERRRDLGESLHRRVALAPLDLPQ